MYLLLSLFIFIIVIVLFAVLSVWGFLRSFFGLGRKPKQKSEPPSKPSNPKREKFFKQNEGEYVDYEEVKEK